MLKANKTQMRGRDLRDFWSDFKKVDWRSFRDADLPRERRNSAILVAVGAAAAGAALMYLLDPGHGGLHRSSARERLTQWYLSGRGQLDHGWRRLQSESPSFDLTAKDRSPDAPTDTHDRTPREEAAT